MAKKKTYEPLDIGAITAAVQKDLGNDETAMCGIEVPSLALQYLLNSRVLPFSKMIEIFGNPGAGKSTFLYEIMRWSIMAGGFAYLGETEQKDSINIRRAICKWNKDYISRITAKYDVTLEGWVNNLNEAITYYDKLYEKYGPSFPVVYGIDAVTSAGTERSFEEFKDEGCGTERVAELANKLTGYVRNLPGRIMNKPASIVFINHSKQKIGATAGFGAEAETPGGKAVKYYSLIRLELTYMGQDKRVNCTTRKIKIKVRKNGIQEVGKEMLVRLRYSKVQDPVDPDKSLLQIEWDWDSADIEFLLDQLKGKEGGADRKKAISAIVDLHETKIGVEGAVWSEALGITEEDPMTLTEAGKVLHANEEVMEKLRGFFLTTNSVCFTQGHNLSELSEQAKRDEDAHMQAISDALYRDVVADEIKIEED